jgi:hypothetical protein
MQRHPNPCLALAVALAVSALTLSIAPASAAQSVWTQTNGPYGGYIQGLLATPTGSIFAGLSGGGVYRFDPDTETWAASGFQPGYVYNLEHGDGVVYATYSDRLYRSEDNGGTWVTDGMPAAQLAVRGETVFTGWGRSIYRSRDGGRTWTRVNGDVPDSRSIDSIGLRGTTVFYAVARQGVWRSDDDGDTWSATSLAGATNIRSWEFIDDVILAHAVTTQPQERQG